MTTEQLEHGVGRISLSDDAPTVDLNMFVVENKGLIIHNHSAMGRVLVADRDFDKDEIGSTILIEKPCLVCQQNDEMGFLEQFLEAPVESQVGILDMFHQPLDSPMGQSLIKPAKLLFMLGVLEDFLVIHQLLSIWKTNGMQWKDNQSALALFASKFSHSCNPNLGFSTSNGVIEFILLRPIAKGEIASFSYLTDLLETPTFERRQLLLDTKSFVCQCDRCMGPDYSRCMQCPTCPNEKIPCYYPYVDEKPFEPMFACSKCGLVDTAAMERTEKLIGEKLDAIDKDMQSITFHTRSSVTPKALHELVEECQSTLSPVHHMTMRAMRLLFSLSTTLAYDYMKKILLRKRNVSENMVYGMLQTSVYAGFELALAGECCAANSPGGYRGDTPNTFLLSHDANFDRALPVLHALENLLQLPLAWWPPHSIEIAKRYLPYIKVKYAATTKNQENSVDKMELNLNQLSKCISCQQCGTFWDGSKKAVEHDWNDKRTK
ncbi:unnamed protein product [Cylindrotheca closterium]|uniref:SET domain-containing protein n=1 Tax=Cylindrotheca closterium TaxID=2856 RepID=A0AAD2FF48_9STRA|nr:unnamed protein product [Cylindrotheca closterium]